MDFKSEEFEKNHMETLCKFWNAESLGDEFNAIHMKIKDQFKLQLTKSQTSAKDLA